MSVTVETPIASSIANGVTTVFPHNFTVLSASDLVVKGELNGFVTTYALGVDYTLSGVGTGAGSVTFLVAPANGAVITRYRDSLIQRLTDYQDNGDLLAETVNLDFDRIWLLLQEIFNGGKGAPTALRVPNGETVPALVAAASRASKFLFFNANGEPSVVSLPDGVAVSSSDQVAWAQLGAGAVGRTVQDKLRDVLDVRDFGAVGNGVADDTSAIQAALTEAATRDGTVWIPDGTFLFTELAIAAGVTLRGQSLLAVLKIAPASAALSNRAIKINGPDVLIERLSFDSNLHQGSDASGMQMIGVETPTVAADNVRIVGCTFINGYLRAYINHAASIQSRGFHVKGCRFFGQAVPVISGRNTQGIRVLATASVHDIQIEDNYFRYCEMPTQVRASPTAGVFGWFQGVSWCRNMVIDSLDSTVAQGTPLELFSTDNAVVQGNRIHSSGRGVSACYVRGGTYSGNAFIGQKLYAMEMQRCDGILFAGNTALDCKNLVNETTVETGSNNVVIRGNLMRGGALGIVGLNDTTNSRPVAINASAVGGYQNWVVSDNTFIDVLYTGAVTGSTGNGTCINVNHASASNWTIEGNTFIQSDDRCGIGCITVTMGSRVVVRGNRVLRTVNITDNSHINLSAVSFIGMAVGAGSDIDVDGNTIIFTGSDVRTGSPPGPTGIGSSAAGASLPGVVVRRNRLKGVYANSLNLPYTDGDTIVEYNDLTGATGGPSLNAAIIRKRMHYEITGTAAPASGTWARGDRCFNINATVGQPKSWVCTVAGTPGTWVSEGNL